MRLFLTCVVSLLGLAAAQVDAQPLKIGYVNSNRLESESALAQQNMEVLKKEFAPREQQLNEMQKQGAALQAELEKPGTTMPAAERQAKEKRLAAIAQQFQQMQRSLGEDLDARRRDSFAGYLAEVDGIIKGIAEAGKYDLIVQQSVYSSKQIDITDQVLKEIAKRAAVAPPARK